MDCDIAVVGAGPAGMLAAIRAAALEKRVVLIERNKTPGRKLLLTGQGRCNLTNTSDIETFIAQFGRQGGFFRPAFSAFFHRELMNFFQERGLALKAERQGRVFPVTDAAGSIVQVLKQYLAEHKVRLWSNRRLVHLGCQGGLFQLEMEDKERLAAHKVILATGGASYQATGSSGDGFRLAEKLGHTVVPLKPALVPLKTKEQWVKKVQGLALKNIRLIFKYGQTKITSEIGEMMFTHFGISGPLVLDLSGRIVAALEAHKEIELWIDLKPALTAQQLDSRLLKEFSAGRKMQLKNLLKGFLPKRLIGVFLELAAVAPQKLVNQLSRKERQAVAGLFKGLPLTITGALALEEAMVTNGGISTAEINPRTMESKLVPGLYFAGEIIDGCAPSGGYNLQQAFSTGYLAGEKAAADA